MGCLASSLVILGSIACSDGEHGWKGEGESDGSSNGDSGYGSPGDGSPLGEAGDSAPLVVEGCTVADFAANDHSDPADPRLVAAPADATPAPFSPKCMRVKVGQTITWKGDLANHPLEFDVSGLGGPGTARFELAGPDGSPNENSVTVLNAGTMAYHCAHHPSLMVGAVQVVK
jgi:plastocyanin